MGSHQRDGADADAPSVDLWSTDRTVTDPDLSVGSDGKVSGTVGKRRAAKQADGQVDSRERRATLAKGTLSAEEKTSSRVADPELGGKVIETRDRARGIAVGHGKVGVNTSSKDQTEVDGHTFTKERAKAVASDGSFNLSSRTSHAHKDDHGSELHASDWAAGYVDGQATGRLGTQTSSRVVDPELGGKVIETREAARAITYGKGKLGASLSSKEQTEVDGQTFASERGTTLTSDGSFKTSSSKNRTFTDDEGEHTHRQGTSLTAGKDGGALTHERSKTTRDGASSQSSLGAALDTRKGTGSVNGSYALTTKGGTQARAGGGLTLDRHGNLVGANASASVTTKGGWTPSVAGEYKVEASEPRKEGDRYVVDWSRTAKGSLGLSKAGGKLGLAASAEKSERDFGSRMFRSKEEADHFRKNAASMIGGAFGAQTTVEGALAMGIGESRGVGDTSRLGGELTGHLGVAEIGVGGEKSKEDALLVERLSPTIFQITVAAKADQEVHAGFGISGVGASGYQGGGESHATTVQFDLSTAAGKAAFEEYQRTKVMPRTGAERISQTDAHDARHGTRISFGPAGSAQFGANQWESVTAGKEGKKAVFGGENSQSVVSNIPFFKGHDAAALSVVATMVNDKDRFYTMQGNVDSTDGDYSQKFLAKITGTHTDGGPHTSSGKWRVDVNIDDAIVDKFLGKVADQKVRDVGIAEALTRGDFKNELRKLIAAARTPEDKMRALSYFIAESGLDSHQGIDAMRAEVFGLTGDQWNLNSKVAGTFHSDLFLEKDPHKVFNGVEGRLAVEAKIGQYADLLQASDKAGAALVGSMQSDIAELERKRSIVMDVANYTDLPPELRQMQLDTFGRQIDSLRQLRNLAAKDGVRDLGPDEGKHDTSDPKTKELRTLRRTMSALDAKIAAHKQHLAEMLPGIRNIPRGAPAAELRAAYLAVKEGDAQQRAALEAEPAADELRAGFVVALDSPDAALATGRTCLDALTSVEASLAAAEDGYRQMIDLGLSY